VTAACATKPPRVTLPAPSRAGLVDTLIVSDLHLGLPAACPGALLALLEERRFDRLILLGDFFHDGGSRHLCADAWRLLAHLRRLSHRREAEVVWVLGNHDRHLGHLAAALLGVETTEAFRWSHAGRAFAAVHGDRFDGFVSRHVRMAGFLSRSYAFAQRRLSTGGGWPKLLDRLHAGLSSLSERVEEGAFGYATSHDVDVIVCGHTHRPRRTVFDVPGPAGGGIEYFNTGCWVKRPASFVTVGASGGVALDHRP
jgi:UDP-2,3-diacylglucosamine pyrophosphatase LpxH